jgi:hypothetical protein
MDGYIFALKRGDGNDEFDKTNYPYIIMQSANSSSSSVFAGTPVAGDACDPSCGSGASSACVEWFDGSVLVPVC